MSVRVKATKKRYYVLSIVASDNSTVTLFEMCAHGMPIYTKVPNYRAGDIPAVA